MAAAKDADGWTTAKGGGSPSRAAADQDEQKSNGKGRFSILDLQSEEQGSGEGLGEDNSGEETGGGDLDMWILLDEEAEMMGIYAEDNRRAALAGDDEEEYGGDFCACKRGEDCLFYGQEVERTVECISCSNTLSQACVEAGESQAQWDECRTCWGVIRGKDTGARGLWSKVAATVPLSRERDRVEEALGDSGGVWEMGRGARSRLLRQLRSGPTHGSGPRKEEQGSRRREGTGVSGLRARYSPQELGQEVHRIDWDDIETMTDETQEEEGNGQDRQRQGQEQERVTLTTRWGELDQERLRQQEEQLPPGQAVRQEEPNQEARQQVEQEPLAGR